MRRGGFFKMFLILAAISLVLDWYIYNGLKTITTGWKAAWARKLVLWGYLIISIAVTLVFIGGFSFTDLNHGLNHFHEWSLSIFLTFFVTKLVFIIVLSLGDLGRFVKGVARNVGQPEGQQTRPYFPARRKFISELAVFLAAIPFSGFFYAMFRGKYDYKLHRHIVYFKDLPEAFDGFTITQLSDIHSGSFDNTKAMQKGIDMAIAQKSDLFVFTGDIVNNMADEIEPYIDRFKQIKAPYGQFSILGNHDYATYIEWESEAAKNANLDKLKQHHKAMDYRLLLNEHIELEKGGQKIVLAGVENWGRGFIQVGDLDKALHGVDDDAFTILLSHDPTHWEEKVRYHKKKVQLTLSGHTHGAQFGVETAGFRWSPVQNRYLDWAGLMTINDRNLYVNRGFGFLAFSGRLGIWPEVTVIELRRQA
ncbi:metallophosphoesterase [Mucilaginibacter gynuensis]|uniref:Metallophosphoesterase n=1 Tax=Mucilaginibacter gynuensis TaxID=1302236 RepID=A0ABP8HG58_9SPHI